MGMLGLKLFQAYLHPYRLKTGAIEKTIEFNSHGLQSVNDKAIRLWALAQPNTKCLSQYNFLPLPVLIT